MTVEEYLTGKIVYDEESQSIFVEQKGGYLQIICDIRGWGHIQNMFKDKNKIDLQKAAAFQDLVGNWIKEAIEEKLNKK